MDENTFEWREHISSPLKNLDGVVIPNSIVEEYMKEVRTLEEFRSCFSELIKVVLLPGPSPESLRELTDIIQQNFGE